MSAGAGSLESILYLFFIFEALAVKEEKVMSKAVRACLSRLSTIGDKHHLVFNYGV